MPATPTRRWAFFPFAMMMFISILAVGWVQLQHVAPGEPGSLGPNETLLIIAIFGVALFGYLLPSFIAFLRDHPNFAPILVINVLLGWTLVGYVAALAWSLTAFRKS